MHAANEDYFSFEDVLGELEMGEEELKRMVSEGELRAFRDENKMKFRIDDVENLKRGRTSEPTLILPSDTDIPLDISAPVGAETSIDLDSVDDADLDISNIAPTLELADTNVEGDDAMGTVTEELVFDEDLTFDTEPVDVADTFVEEDMETGLTTEPLELIGDEFATEAIAIEDDEEAIPTIAAPVTAEPARPRRARRARPEGLPPAVEAEIEARKPSAAWTFLLVASFLAMAYAGMFLYDLLRVENSYSAEPMEMTMKWGEKVLNAWYTDELYPSSMPIVVKDPYIQAIPDYYRKPTWTEDARLGVLEVVPVTNEKMEAPSYDE